MSSTIFSAFLCLGTVTAIVFNAGPDSIINVRNSPYDTIPQGKAKQKKIQYSFYNSTLNKVEVRYTDGSTELMNIEEAKKKKIQYLEVKVEVEKFTPP